VGDWDWIGDLGQAITAPVAAGYQLGAVNKARGTQQAQYGVDKGYYQPYYDAGTGALSQLQANLGAGAFNVNVTPQNLQNDPGYQFQLQQGQQALQRSAAAQGGLQSGGFAKALDQYSQGLASTQYQNAWNRQFQQNQFKYNSLANMAGMGQSAAGSLANLGQNYGNTMAGYDIDEGNIHAGSLMGQAQLGGEAASGATSAGVKYGTMAAGGAMGMGTSGVSGLSSMMGGGGGGGGGGGSNSQNGLSANNPLYGSSGQFLGYSAQPTQVIPQQGGGFGSIGYDGGGGGYSGPYNSMPNMEDYGYSDPLGGYGNGGAYSLIPPQTGGY
jgi:hypothetical protein